MRAREIERVLHGGRSFHGERVVIFMAPGDDRCAVIAGRKVGGAVQRNRARRVLRAAWPSIAPLASESDVVLVARAGILHAKTQELVEEMRDVLQGATVR